ncbi:MAG TPA: hypothetical protein VJM50_01545 [Pyrinomonadaceae bacterium]|nr:hypothetical protein [Pyrinomonadaceae bacterium]
MNDWIGLGIIAFLILCGLFALSRLSKPYDVSVEEFERRAKEGPGLLGAGLAGLQKALDPAMQKAVEAQEDFKRGRYNKEDESGDPPEGGDDRRSDEEKSDGETG